MGRYPSDTIRGTGSPSGAEQGHSTLHFEPLFYGSLGGTAFTFPAPPVTKQEALQQPLTPLLPALDCCPLPPPGASKLTPPPGLQIKVGPLSGSRRLSMLGEEKITFPIAPSPDIRPFSSPPTAPSTGPATATAPQLSPFTTSSTSGVEDTSTDAGRYPQTLMIPRLDPLYPFILFVALGLGTIYTRLEATGRYTLLWTILLATGMLLTYANGNNRAEKPSANSLLWGVGFGLVFSLPLLILVSSGLSSMVDILFPGALMSTRFQSLVIIAPAAETLFFRGAVQEHRGIVFGMLGAGITGLLIYWPVAAATPGYLAAMGLFTVVLAGIYSFVRMRNGLGAALASQITVNFMLLYLPSLFR